MKAKNTKDKKRNGRKKQLVAANQIVSSLALLKGNGCHLKEKFSRQRDLASNLIQTLPSFFVAIDADGKTLMMNESMLQALGYTAEEVEGKDYLTTFVPASDRKKLSNIFKKLVVSKESTLNENYILTKDNQKILVEWHGRPVFKESGDFDYFFGVGIDITERKRANEALRESEKKFKELYESAPDGYFTLDEDGKITEANKTLVEIMGYEKKELKGKPFSLFMSEGIKEEFNKTFPQFNEKCFTDKEFRLVRKNGAEVYVRFRSKAKQNGNGGFLEYNCTLRDITKRKETENKLKALYDLSKKVSSIVSKEDLLPWIAEEAVKLLDVDECVYRIREGDYLIKGGGTEEGMMLMKKEKLKIGESLSGKIALEKKPLVVKDMRGEKMYIKEHREIAKRLGFVSFLGVPMMAEDKVVGVMNVITRKPRKFSKTDIEVLTAFSDHAAIALQNARLFENLEKGLNAYENVEEKLQESMGKLRKAMGGIINTMALTVETKDPYTAGHQKRVSDLARSIATEMRLSIHQIDAIRMAGSIHDLGKISIPGEILSKPGKISEAEFNLIKTHTQVGYDLLKEIDFPWPIAKIVLQHHERLNGSGYPQGLSGKDIVIEARIIAVADVVEAMASHRPYRPSLGIDTALEEISKNKGILYDPKVADVCLRLFKEKSYEFK